METRQIEARDGLSLRVFNELKDTFRDPSGLNLSKNAIFVIPYDGREFMLGEKPNHRQSRINVLYSGIVGVVKVSKKGIYSEGYGICSQTIKDLRVRYNDKPQRQVEGYLSLLRLTEGQPVSVVLVENKHGLPIEEISPMISEAYGDAFISENRVEFDKKKLEAVKTAKKSYSIFSVEGWRRRLNNKTMTAYFLGDKETISQISSLTHPSKKVEYIPFY